MEASMESMIEHEGIKCDIHDIIMLLSPSLFALSPLKKQKH